MPQVPKIQEILHSGALSFGKYGHELEQKLSDFFGARYLAVTSTFTNAITIALVSYEIQYGDEAIMSPMACLSSTQPYLSHGLRIVWADVDNMTGTLDPDDVRKKITAKTKVIVHNHFCGYPGYIAEVNRIGRDYGIPVFNDGIECFGAEYHGKLVGNDGADATIFSFNPVRIPNTIDGAPFYFRIPKNSRKRFAFEIAA